MTILLLMLAFAHADQGLTPVAVHCTSQYAYSPPGPLSLTIPGPRIDLPINEGQAASADAQDSLVAIGVRVGRGQNTTILLEARDRATASFERLEARGKLPKQGTPLVLAANRPAGLAVDGTPVDRIEVSCSLETRSDR
jgi:hypothetical protein